MRHATVGGALAHVHQPLTQHRLVDQRRPPEGATQTRKGREALDVGGGEMDDGAAAQGADGVVHPAQHGHLQVTEVARRQERHDLPPPIA